MLLAQDMRILRDALAKPPALEDDIEVVVAV